MWNGFKKILLFKEATDDPRWFQYIFSVLYWLLIIAIIVKIISLIFPNLL